MATELENAYKALEAADAAGDAPGAQELAKYIQALETSAKAKEHGEISNRNYDLSEVPLEAAKSLVGWGDRPSSAVGIVGDMANAALSPIDTGAGLSQLTAGAANLALPEDGIPTMNLPAPAPGSQKSVMGIHDPTSYPTGEGTKFEMAGSTGEDLARGVGQMYKDQYGSRENIKRTMAEDPAIPLLDALTLAAPAGKVGTLSRKLMSIPSRIVQGSADKFGKFLYGTAIKKYLPKDIAMQEALFDANRLAIEVGRKGGYTLDEAGFRALKADVVGKSAELGKVLQAAEDAGKTVEFTKVWNSLDDISDTARVSSLKPVSLQREAQGVKGQHQAVQPKITDYSQPAPGQLIDGSSGTVRGADYTPNEALTLKRALQKDLNFAKVGEGSNAERVASAAHKSLKEGLEAVDPRIVPLNKELSPKLRLKDAILDAAVEGRSMSASPIGTSAGARLAANATVPIAAPAASLGGLLYSPARMAKHGIKATNIAQSPLLETLLNAAGPSAYAASRTKKRKKKKKGRRR